MRTYLPDGDIDVCLLGPHELLSRDDWTVRLRAHVERAEAAAAEASAELGSPAAEFAVSEIHIIHAEVKLMKLICDGVVVDVSANQFGGLAALGFLEEVNAFIGKGEIFKRSIVLIKAWGFYEGRMLGAHHALISTYALETLVLYIFNRFHKELSTPLEVLHKFLVFFADFDWDKFAVSVHGPVPLEDLHKVTGPIGKRPEVHAEGALLTPDFMWRMMDKYGNESVSAKLGGGANSTPRHMARKYLNVVDPLLSSNNLGRSVSQGNAKRIRKALALGAQRLTALRESSTGGECFGAVRMLEQFFGNTMRHRRLGPMPHLPMAPSTPGFAGRNHADEVSMTPARCPRTGAVSVLASPSSPSQYQSPLPRSVDGQPPGSASSRMATKGTEAPAARTRRKTPVAAGEDGEEDDGRGWRRRLRAQAAGDGIAREERRIGRRRRRPLAAPRARRHPMPRAPARGERGARGEGSSAISTGRNAGPFGAAGIPSRRRRPSPNTPGLSRPRGFPALDAREGTKGTRCPVLAAAAREEDEVVASANARSRRATRGWPYSSVRGAPTRRRLGGGTRRIGGALGEAGLGGGGGGGSAAGLGGGSLGRFLRRVVEGGQERVADRSVVRRRRRRRQGRRAGSVETVRVASDASEKAPAAPQRRPQLDLDPARSAATRPADLDGRSPGADAPRDELPDVLPGARAARRPAAAAAARAAGQARAGGAPRRVRRRLGRVHRQPRGHMEPPPVRPGVPSPRDRANASVRGYGRRPSRVTAAQVWRVQQQQRRRRPQGRRRRRGGVQQAQQPGRRRSGLGHARSGSWGAPGQSLDRQPMRHSRRLLPARRRSSSTGSAGPRGRAGRAA